MIGTRRLRPFQSGRSLFGLLSVLALAFACFPVLAQADSSGVQYEDAPPTATGEQPTARHEPPAVSSSAETGGATAPASHRGGSTSGKGSSSGDKSSESGGAAAGGSNGGPGKGSPATAAQNEGIAAEKKLSQGSPAGQAGGGSSPLVPILIAIGVLAAISLGALAMRQRRQRQGTFSPEAS